MKRIELYKNLKMATLADDRQKLLLTIEGLIREAELLKSQVEDGHIFNAHLTERGRQVDEMVNETQHTMGTIALLNSIQNDEED